MLLLDMDLRKSVLVSRFEMGKVQYGMSHFYPQCPLSDVIVTNVPKLHVAVAGPSTPNTQSLASRSFTRCWSL
ncbi:MAG: hypothetical protein ACLSXO_00365 [Coprococcus sp.]